MNDSNIVLYLFVATFAAVIVYGLVQLWKTRKAKLEDKHSAMADARHEKR